MSLIDDIPSARSRMVSAAGIALSIAADTQVTPARLCAEVGAIRLHWGHLLPLLATLSPTPSEAVQLGALQTAGGDLLIAWEQTDGATWRPAVPAGPLDPEARALATASINAAAMALAGEDVVSKSPQLRAAATALRAAIEAML